MSIQSTVQSVIKANDGRSSMSARSMADPHVIVALRALALACGLTVEQSGEARPHELASIFNVAFKDATHAPAVANRVLQTIGKRRPDLLPIPATVVPATGPAVATPAPVDPSPMLRQLEALEARLATQEAEIEALRNASPKRVTIERPDAPPVTIDNPHMMLERVLGYLTDQTHVYCYGPAGSGKTTLGEHCAKAMGLPFYAVSSVQDTTELTGFKSLTTGEYITTAFRRCFEYGGVFLFDEIDNSKAAAITAFNMALAQGYFAFPDGIVVKHKDCYLMAGANTVGNGQTNMYQRAKLDGATLNRFARVFIPYDESLEMLLAPNKDWADLVQLIRSICADEGIEAIISPRQTIAGGKALNRGANRDEVLNDFIFAGMTETQINTIRSMI